MQSQMAGVDEIVVIDVGAAMLRGDCQDQLAVAHPKFGQGGPAVVGGNAGSRAHEQFALAGLVQIWRVKSSRCGADRRCQTPTSFWSSRNSFLSGPSKPKK